jgi:3alpha(or 20beta)-hydroxysteroid dehydrogenase
MADLVGRVALITGASRGQGAARARLRHACSPNAARRSSSPTSSTTRPKSLAADIGADRAIAVHLNVSDPRDWQGALDEAITPFGYVDVLVNNAGIFHQGDLIDTHVELYRRLIEVNQIGVFPGMQVLAKHMAELGRGSIINIVSVCSFAPLDGTSAYASTKSALLALSKAAVGELGPKGIRVNMIHPGGVATEMGHLLESCPRNTAGPRWAGSGNPARLPPSLPSWRPRTRRTAAVRRFSSTEDGPSEHATHGTQEVDLDRYRSALPSARWSTFRFAGRVRPT